MTSMNKIFAGYEQRRRSLERSEHPFANGVAWVAGELAPVSEARIPLLDQGFLRSDLTYDVPAVWDGSFFRLDDHLKRLETSCHKVRLTLPLSKAEIQGILLDMVSQSGIRDAFVDIIVTRGLQGVRGATSPFVCNLYMFVVPYVWTMAPKTQLIGGSAVIARTVRRTPPGSMDPTVKNLQWGDFTRGLFEAKDRGAEFPFLTDGDGNLTEGSGFNICIAKDGEIFTADRGVLEGVTRKSVMDVAHANGIGVRLQVVPVEMAYKADEIFMCTTAGGIMPITVLDGQPVGSGSIGRITTKIWDSYWQMHYDSKYTTQVDYNAPKARL